MAELHVMDALRGKRSELGGIVSHLEQQIVQHRASLVISTPPCGYSTQASRRRRPVPGNSGPAASGSILANACG